MIGSSIGANNVALGKRIRTLTMLVAWLICGLESLICYFVRDSIAELYTADQAVQAIIVATIPLVCFEYVCDAGACLTSGPVRALGIQSKAAGWILVSYYVVALPVGLLSAFKFDLGIVGLWIGNTLGVTVQALTYLVITSKTDWQEKADEAFKTMKKFRDNHKQSEEIEFEMTEREEQPE